MASLRKRRNSWSHGNGYVEMATDKKLGLESALDVGFKELIDLRTFNPKAFPVLLVGKEHLLSAAVINILQRRGFKDIKISSEREALTIAKESTPSYALVILALGRGKIGMKILQTFKMASEWEAVPMFVLCSKPNERQVARLMDLGACDVIVPPLIDEHFMARAHTELRMLWLGLRHEYLMSQLVGALGKSQAEVRRKLNEATQPVSAFTKFAFDDFLKEYNEHMDAADYDDLDDDVVRLREALGNDVVIAENVAIQARMLRKMTTGYSRMKFELMRNVSRTAFLRLKLARAQTKEKQLFRLQVTGQKEGDKPTDEEVKNGVALQKAMRTPIEIIADSIAKLYESEELSDEMRADLEVVMESLASRDLFRPAFANILNSETFDPTTKAWLADMFELDEEIESLATSGGGPEVSAGLRIDPSLIEQDDSKDNVDMEKARQWDFNMFVEVADEQLESFVVQMMQDLNLFQKYGIPVETFKTLLENMREIYERRNPYHNWRHACDVFHMLYLLVVHTDVSKYFRGIDILSLFVSALGHDVGHPGTNNNFHINRGTELALTYNDTSVLESFHASRLFQLLADKPTAILQSLPKDMFKDLRKLSIHSIVHTDAGTHHFSDLSRFSTHLDTGPFERDNLDHRLLLADISNQVRTWDVAYEWGTRVQNEFFRQGDVERLSNMPVSPFMDRKAAGFAKLNVGFINVMVMPLFTGLARLLKGMDPIVQQMRSNLEKWTELQRVEGLEDRDHTGAPPSPSTMEVSMTPLNMIYTKRVEALATPGTGKRRGRGRPLRRGDSSGAGSAVELLGPRPFMREFYDSPEAAALAAQGQNGRPKRQGSSHEQRSSRSRLPALRSDAAPQMSSSLTRSLTRKKSAVTVTQERQVDGSVSAESSRSTLIPGDFVIPTAPPPSAGGDSPERSPLQIGQGPARPRRVRQPRTPRLGTVAAARRTGDATRRTTRLPPIQDMAVGSPQQQRLARNTSFGSRKKPRRPSMAKPAALAAVPSRGVAAKIPRPPSGRLVDAGGVRKFTARVLKREEAREGEISGR